MSHDLYSNLKATQTLAPAVYDADKNAAAIDLKGLSTCLLLVIVGAADATLSKTVKIDLEVEETDDTDNGTWTDVADAVSGANDGCFTVYVTQYRDHKRYCRVVVNFTSTHAPARSSALPPSAATPTWRRSTYKRMQGRLRLITLPAIDPVTLAHAKLHARIDHEVEDALRATFIAAARQHGEQLTGWQFVRSRVRAIARGVSSTRWTDRLAPAAAAGRRNHRLCGARWRSLAAARLYHSPR